MNIPKIKLENEILNSWIAGRKKNEMYIFSAKSCIYLPSFGNDYLIFYRKNTFECLVVNGHENPTIFVHLYLSS